MRRGRERRRERPIESAGKQENDDQDIGGMGKVGIDFICKEYLW